MTLNDIPREDLIAMLKDAAWYSGQREEFGTFQGYSFDVSETTAHQDVAFRFEPLYQTPEEAILAHWQRHYATEFKQLESNLLHQYSVAVMKSQDVDSLEEISAIWGEMVKFCDDSLNSLPDTATGKVMATKILEIRTKCERLQGMHAATHTPGKD